MKQVDYISEKKIIRKYTNEGFKSKLYVDILIDDDGEATIVLRKVLFTNEINSRCLVLKKLNDGLFLCEQCMSLKMKTFNQAIDALNSITNFYKVKLK